MLYILTVIFGLATMFLVAYTATEEMHRRTNYYRKQLHTSFVHCESGMEAQLHRTYYVVGRRRRRADLALDFCNDPSIARVHATLWYDGTQFCIAPAQNGFGKKISYPAIFVNGIPIPNRGIPLVYGDTIRMGNHHFILKNTEQEG